MDWQEIVIEVTLEGVEAVANIAHEMGAGGVAIEDPQMVKEKIEEGAWDAYELPDHLLQGENALVKVYLPANEYFPRRLEDLKQRLDVLNNNLLPGCIKGLCCAKVKEEDWATSWKKYYKPLRVGQSILIKPTWEEADVKEGDIVIELDPGMAFGTGTHPTTTLCLELVERLAKPGIKVYDVGTGSGILAITAAKLGAEVTAVDMDEVAVKAAGDNAALNGMENLIHIKQGDLLSSESEKVDLIVANIVADVILKVIPQAKDKLKPGGHLLTSGIFIDRVAEIEQSLRENGFKEIEKKQSEEWVALLAVKEA